MQLVKFDFNNIPEKLKKLPQFILWKTEERKNGKLTKIPYQVNGKEARANDYTTWSFFDTAYNFFNESDASGIGFVFSKEDNFIGVDIDGCVSYSEEDENKENPIINDFAQLIIDTLDSYTELSVSGTGIHIIVEGELPDSICGTGRKNSKLGLEIYRYGRYFTMTGNVIGEKEIFNRTNELKGIMDMYFDDSDIKARVVRLEDYQKDHLDMSNSDLWERMFNSKNGQQIRDMFNGILSVNDDHSSTDLAMCNYLAFWTGKSASRMDQMFRETGLMRDKWDRIHHSSTGETYGERTISMAIASTTSTIMDKKHEKQYKDVILKVKQKELTDDSKPTFRLTELGNAERVSYERGDDIKFIRGGKWMIWNGKKWVQDDGTDIQGVITEVMSALHNYGDEAQKKWAMRCESLSNIRNTTSLLKTYQQCERSEFDKDKYLFNVNNGILDLKTGDLLPHDREKMISKISPINYDKYALCPNWLKFIDQITLGDKELASYLQRLIGYSMTGDIKEQIITFFVGGGANGKSTFLNILNDIMGDYGKQTDPKTFMRKKEGAPTNDIARLNGSRFVSAVESEDSEQLSESLVKQITGGEPITARFLHEEFFEFKPEFKVFFTTNHKPIIKGLDEGIWRRVKLVPFNLKMEEKDKDKSLPDKLKEEMSGILNWCLEGCLEWQKQGLNEPDIVKMSSEKYRNEMDIIQPFIEKHLEIDPKSKVLARDVYQKYTNFCWDEGEKHLGNRAFYRMMHTKGFEKKMGKGGNNYILGIKMKGVTTNPEKVVVKLNI